MSRPQLEVADIVRQHGKAYLERYGATMSSEQHRALRAIALCRTAALGGHKTRCDHCGHEEQSYNSCRHRSCPKCHGAAQAAWLEARRGEVLPTSYVHVIFTLPYELSSLVLQNQRMLYGLPMTRSGFEYILQKHVKTATQACKSLQKKSVSPHVLRHTSAMLVLQATGDIRKVALWLGHDDIQTTEVYLRADPTEKLEAIDTAVPPTLKRGEFRMPDKLMALLHSD